MADPNETTSSQQNSEKGKRKGQEAFLAADLLRVRTEIHFRFAVVIANRWRDRVEEDYRVALEAGRPTEEIERKIDEVLEAKIGFEEVREDTMKHLDHIRDAVLQAAKAGDARLDPKKVARECKRATKAIEKCSKELVEQSLKYEKGYCLNYYNYLYVMESAESVEASAQDAAKSLKDLCMQLAIAARSAILSQAVSMATGLIGVFKCVAPLLKLSAPPSEA